MPTKPLKPGAEVDSYCTKCRMDLMHRIIAMNNGKIIRVECRTCNGHHNYRKPKSAASEPPLPTSTAQSSSTRPASPGAGSSRKAAAAKLEQQRQQTWETAATGH